jgi:hypothetical protein
MPDLQPVTTLNQTPSEQMGRKKNTMSFENDDAIVTELVQFTENEGDIHTRTVMPIIKNLATKKAQGKYDSEKAVQAFMYLAEAGARKYARVLGGDERQWHDTFPINIRRGAATHWRDEFETEFATGNYDDLLPKKYRKTQKLPDRPPILLKKASAAKALHSQLHLNRSTLNDQYRTR